MYMVSEKDIEDWKDALVALTNKGKELGIPLNVIELLKKSSESLVTYFPYE